MPLTVPPTVIDLGALSSVYNSHQYMVREMGLYSDNLRCFQTVCPEKVLGLLRQQIMTSAVVLPASHGLQHQQRDPRGPYILHTGLEELLYAHRARLDFQTGA